MALQTTGAISLNDIHIEVGGTTGTTVSLNDADIRGLTAASGKTINTTLGTEIDFNDLYGASVVPPFDYTAGDGAVPTAGPYYTLVTTATTRTQLPSGTYNFIMVGRGGEGAGSASSIAFWTIQLNGSESWSFTTPTATGSSYFTDWQIVGDSSTLVRARHGTDSSASTTSVGTMGSSSRLTNKAQRIGGAGVANDGYSNGGGGSVDFFNLSDKSRLNGTADTVAAGYGTPPSGGHIKESGNPASGTKWLTGLSDTDFGQAIGTYTNITVSGHFNVGGANGHNPFGGGGGASANNYGSSGSVYINILNQGYGGYGGGGAFSRQQSLNNPKFKSFIGGPPALWYLRTGN